MILFPAIDIKNGKVVRLLQGRKDAETVFAENPLAMAKHWQDLGADWLHIIDLDGAFDGSSQNVAVIEKICQLDGLKIQVGGGIRNAGAAKRYINAGATRLISGTLALENRPQFDELCAAFPGKIGVSLDAEKGALKTRGWEADANARIEDVVPGLSNAAFIIYTDIEKDGTHAGPNLQGLEEVLKLSPVPVITAGGISTVQDLETLAKLKKYQNFEGAISGRALYDGTLDFKEGQRLLSA